MSAEKRWIILPPDGGHISIGRDTDPSEDEIEAAAGMLRQAGGGGWFAMKDGAYYGQRKVPLLMMREIVPAGGSWVTAVAAFEWTRRAATASPRIGDHTYDPTWPGGTTSRRVTSRVSFVEELSMFGTIAR